MYHADPPAHMPRPSTGPGPDPGPAADAAYSAPAPPPLSSWPVGAPSIYDSTAWRTTATRAPHHAALASATIPSDHASLARHTAGLTRRANAPDGPLPPPWPPSHPRASSSSSARDPRDGYSHDYYPAPHAPTHAGRDRDYPAYAALPPPAHSAAELAAAARRFDGSAGRTAVRGADSPAAYASPPLLATQPPTRGSVPHAQPDGPSAVDSPHPWPRTATDGLVRAYLPYDPAPMRGASALAAGAAAALTMPGGRRAADEQAAKVSYAPPPPPLPPPATRPGWGAREGEWYAATAPGTAPMYGHGAAGSYSVGPYAGPPPPLAYAHAPGPYYDGWGAPAPPAGWRGSYPDPASTPRYGEVSDRDAWGPRPTTQNACVPSQHAAVLYADRQCADTRYPASNYASAAYPDSEYVPAAPYPTSDYVRAPTAHARYSPAPPGPPESPAQYAYPSAYAHDAFPHDAAPRPATADVDYPPVPALPEAADPIPAVPLPLATPPKATARANHDDDDEDDDRGSNADVEVTGTAGKGAGSDGDGDGDGGKARRHYTEFTKFTYELMVASLVAGPRGGRWGAARKHTTPIDVVRSALHAALRHPPGADPSTIASAPHDPTRPLRIFTLEEALRLAAATRAPPHELAGISRKKWARLKACLRIVSGRPLYRCLAWVGGGDAILAPREDWDMIVRDAHLHLNEATGMVEHRSLKQTFLAVKEQYQTRRSRSGIGYEACELFCQACVCYGALDRTAEAGAASTGGGVGAEVDAGAVPAE